MDRPTVRQLEYIVAVAEHAHFGRAADAVDVSQPGLSAQIRDVERRLGVTLFERTTRAVTLTPAGEAMARWGRSILRDLDQMVLEAREQVGLHGRLAVGVIPTMAPYILPSLVAHSRARWPEVRLEIVERPSEPLVAEIESGALDVGLLALPYDTRRLAVAPVGDEQFVLAVPDAHPLADARSVDLDVLKDLSVLLLSEGHCLRDHALSACEIAGRVDHSEVKGASLSTLCQMVAADIGVTLLPSGAIPVEARPGSGVRWVPFEPAILGRTIALVWRDSDPRGPLYTELGALLATTDWNRSHS